MQNIICAICGREFQIKGGNVKYCSTDCKKVGQRQRRKEWETRTGYREKQRAATADYRAEQARIAEQEVKEADQKRKAAETKARRKKERKEAAELKAKAAKGDKMSLLRLALKEGNALEYWRLYKEIVLEENERLDMVGRNTVGGIDVYDDAFEYKVLELLREQREKKEAQGYTKETGEYYDE